MRHGGVSPGAPDDRSGKPNASVDVDRCDAEHFVERAVGMRAVGEAGGVSRVGDCPSRTRDFHRSDQARPPDIGWKGQTDVAREQPA